MLYHGNTNEQTMIGRTPRCYIPSFLNNIFEGFSPYMGMVAILVM